MEGLNLRGDPAPAEEPPSEEPLGLDLIRGWLTKPRPRLRRLLRWGPYLAKGVRKGYRWLRANSGPALRRTAETLRKTARVAQALRGDRRTVEGAIGKDVPSREAGAARWRGIWPRAAGRSAAPRSRSWASAAKRSASKRFGNPSACPANDRPNASALRPDQGRSRPPKHRMFQGTNEPRVSTDAGAGEPGRSLRFPRLGGIVDKRGILDPNRPHRRPSPPVPSSAEPSSPEAPEPEPSREDPPATGSAEPAPADTSPVPGVPPGPRAEALAKLSKDLRGDILILGKRPRKAWLRYTVWRILNECGERTSEQLGLLLQIDPANLAKRHLSPLVDEGALERTIPDQIRHPEQAYRSTSRPPGADGAPPGNE